MEHHGEIPNQKAAAIIPARYASTRLPGKLLLELSGEPMILHTLRRAAMAQTVSSVTVATDDNRIFDVVTRNGFQALMTSPLHVSGSDRAAEAAEAMDAGSVIVNVQADEPLISPETIDRAVNAMFSDPVADMVTTSEPFEDPVDVLNPNVVKVVTDAAGYALYFSRSPIPYPRTALNSFGNWKDAFSNEAELVRQYRKHTGLYVYRRDFLLKFSKMKPTVLERLEMLEQLRAVENGARVRVVDSCAPSIGVDTADDLERVRKIFAAAAAVV